MAFDPITAIIDLGKTALQKFKGDAASELDITKLGNNYELEVLRLARDENSDFRQFIIEYEGAAKDSPKLIQYFRALIRPSFTCLVGYMDYIYFAASVKAWDAEKIALLKAINIIVLLFWFGERAVKNSGVIDLLKGKFGIGGGNGGG